MAKMTYEAAYDEAVEKARRLKMDVFIRKDAFGSFYTGLASRNDNDYAVAEIVTPSSPRIERKGGK